MILQRTNNNRTRMNHGFDQLFNDIMGVSSKKNNTTQETSARIPQANILKTDHSFTIELSAPGWAKTDFSISFLKNQLTIKANTNKQKENTSTNYVHKEFVKKSFSRIFTTPQDTEESKITASYREGILSIEIPRKKKTIEKETSKQIKIS